MENATLDLGDVSSSPRLGVVITLKQNKTKQAKTKQNLELLGGSADRVANFWFQLRS